LVIDINCCIPAHHRLKALDHFINHSFGEDKIFGCISWVSNYATIQKKKPHIWTMAKNQKQKKEERKNPANASIQTTKQNETKTNNHISFSHWGNQDYESRPTHFQTGCPVPSAHKGHSRPSAPPTAVLPGPHCQNTQ
jgi:hypothetical protein